MAYSYQGKRALVTGASSGIGACMAELLAKQGANLILVARRKDKLEELQEKIQREHGVEVSVIAKDLNAANAAQELHNETEGKGITVDVLINNAGFAQEGAFLDVELERHQAVNNLNLTALTDLTWHFGRSMQSRRQGAILLVASFAAYTPIPKLAIYAAGKSYVLSLGEALNAELAAYNIHVTTLCPGGTWTEFMDTAGQTVDGLKTLAMMPADAVAKEGLKALRKNKAVVVPGTMYKSSRQLLRLIPDRIRIKLSDVAMN